jgi:hypothetical protein
MKKTFISFVFLITSLAVFSQSFSVDSKSLSVPRYANQAAITAAIPAPTEGAMVYNNGLDQFAYYNGTVWVNLSTGTSGPTLWTANTTTNRITANIGYPAGIEASRFTSNAVTSLSLPLINSVGGSNTFLRYGFDPQSTAAIFQESTTNFNIGGSSINWRYGDESNPQVITNLFGYNGNTSTFAVNGFSQLGTTTTSTTAGITTSQPVIKTILLKGFLTPKATPETNASLTTTVPLPSFLQGTAGVLKVMDIKVIVVGSGASSFTSVSEGYEDNRPTPLTGFQFSTSFDSTNLYIIRNNGNSSGIALQTATVPFRVYITYTN